MNEKLREFLALCWTKKECQSLSHSNGVNFSPWILFTDSQLTLLERDKCSQFCFDLWSV